MQWKQMGKRRILVIFGFFGLLSTAGCSESTPKPEREYEGLPFASSIDWSSAEDQAIPSYGAGDNADEEPPPVLLIRYAAGKTSPPPEADAQIRSFGEYLRSHPETIAYIDGHQDRGETIAEDRGISAGRANRVKTAIVQGSQIDSWRVMVRIYGSTLPVGKAVNEAGRALNRRVRGWIVPRDRKKLRSIKLPPPPRQPKDVPPAEPVTQSLGEGVSATNPAAEGGARLSGEGQ